MLRRGAIFPSHFYFCREPLLNRVKASTHRRRSVASKSLPPLFRVYQHTPAPTSCAAAFRAAPPNYSSRQCSIPERRRP